MKRSEDFETRIRDNLERLKIENQQLRSDLQVKTKRKIECVKTLLGIKLESRTKESQDS